ncbi:lipocalin-like domain-containing protein [Psychromarinibacter sp. S121]|uniref:lipocalin-like domain-containing protein n=1 Tax=Psychromarinibacter sp. S121 TaxID=3415127 RepID=UPI003C7AF0EE
MPVNTIKLSRRSALLSGVGAAAGLAAFTRSGPVFAQDASAPAAAGNTAFSTEPQPIYRLPHDHRLHSGPTYKHNSYNEWQYFTVLGTDKKTGDRISIFICPFRQGWSAETQSPRVPSIFAFSNLDTEEFFSANTLMAGDFTGNAGDPDSEDFSFEYTAEGEGTSVAFSYDHATETWRYWGYNSAGGGANATYEFDVTFTVQAPGYVPAAYHGLENIGWDGGGPGYRHNPETLAGLTRYIAVPRADLTGSITVGGREYDVEGEVWYEHQWGNFRNVYSSQYFWGYMRMDDGTAFTWRQYYRGNDWKDYDPGMTRFMVIHPDNTVEYAFGPSFVYTPSELWTSPMTGVTYPWNGVMTTPLGEFYFGPAFKEQESPGNVPGTAFIEGVGHIRTDGPDGPIVGTGFVELVNSNQHIAPYAFEDLPEEDIFLDFTKVNR